MPQSHSRSARRCSRSKLLPSYYSSKLRLRLRHAMHTPSYWILSGLSPACQDFLLRPCQPVPSLLQLPAMQRT